MGSRSHSLILAVVHDKGNPPVESGFDDPPAGGGDSVVGAAKNRSEAAVLRRPDGCPILVQEAQALAGTATVGACAIIGRGRGDG